MNDFLKAECYKVGSISIANSIICNAKDDNGKIFWRLPSFQNDCYVELEQATIYDGSLGVSYFLVNLYNTTKDKLYLDTAIRSVKWGESYWDNTSPRLSFYTGEFSLPYLFLKLYSSTSDIKFLEKAILYSKRFASHLIVSLGQKPSCDFLNGVSGIILCLLQIYLISFDTELAMYIETLAGYLLLRSKKAIQGIHWDYDKSHVVPICGLAHGPSGVALSLLELGHTFKDSYYLWMAEQAFLYEDFYFNSELVNWPDLRDHKFLLSQFYSNENSSILVEQEKYGKDMVAWCNGAPGIGFARLRAYEITQKKNYATQSLVAAEKVLRDGFNAKKTHSLCHGWAGNASYLLKISDRFNKPIYLKKIRSVGDQMLRSLEENSFQYDRGLSTIQNNNSLFLGSAGIGLFFLELFDTSSKCSRLLSPSIEATLDYSYIKKHHIDKDLLLLATIYPKTYYLATILKKDVFVGTEYKNFKNSGLKWNDFFYKLIDFGGTLYHHKNLLRDILSLETLKHQVETSMRIDAKLSIIDEKNTNTMNNAFVELLTVNSVIKTKNIILVSTQWKWDYKDIPLNVNKGSTKYYLYLMRIDNQIQETWIEYEDYEILNYFSTPSTVSSYLFHKFSTALVDREHSVFDRLKSMLQMGIVEFHNYNQTIFKSKG